jgi:hypothetical protein
MLIIQNNVLKKVELVIRIKTVFGIKRKKNVMEENIIELNILGD